MGLLDGKKGLIFGVANDRSIAWGIAQALYTEGAKLGFSYAGEALERRVRPLAESIGSKFIEPCDVGHDWEIKAVFEKWRQAYGTLDILIHCIAFANRDELHGPFYNTSREGFHLALDVSAYSLTALVKEAQPLMNPGGSIVTLTYYGSQKVMPNYNVMGVAKAALEASVRYLAYDLGPRDIRVNAISAGPIKTLAAAGVSGFKDYYRAFKGIAPLQRNVTAEDVGKTALWLCSDLSSAVTGEVVYVDAGFNILGVGQAE
jgi:enoyl-[acyl-carrier protein] reductase I